jgi:poly(ADP-ribose) glycohydrolase
VTPLPDPDRLRPGLAAALVPQLDLRAFARLRQQLTGRPATVDGLEALVAAEPRLEGQLAGVILPALVRHAHQLLVAGAPLPASHHAGIAARSSLPRADAPGWIAHLLLGTLVAPSPDHPHLDTGPLLASHAPQEQAKLRCVLEYLARTARSPPAGRLEVERVVAPARPAGTWRADPSPLGPLAVTTTGAIEDAAGHLQVDFANQYLGGGVLSGGCVQEEIRFAVAPELLVGMLLSPRMGPEEAILLRGAERYARTRGYAFSLEFDGAFEDPCARAADGTPEVELVAIDAIHFRGQESRSQGSEGPILRELTKARAGFRRDGRELPVATGNWGCGAFNGEPPLKAVIQWLAASAEGRALRYHTFANQRVGALADFAARAQDTFPSVGALAAKLLDVAPEAGGDLYRQLLA